MCHNADMSDSDRTHEMPLATELDLALDAPASPLTFALPDAPPHQPRVIATLRLEGGGSLVIADDAAPGGVLIEVRNDQGGLGTAVLHLTDGEVERAIVAIRSAHWVKG